MNRVPFLLVVLTVVFGCTDTPNQPEAISYLTVSYGFEPTPFAPANQLGAVLNNLNTIQMNLDAMEPLDFQGMEPLDKQAMEPLDKEAMEPLDRHLYGLWGQLDAMENTLWVLRDRTLAAMLAADAVPPDPCCEAGFEERRQAVFDKGEEIRDRAYELAEATLPAGVGAFDDRNLLIMVSNAAAAVAEASSG